MEVKRTYFEDDSICPTFEMEDGSIRRPYTNGYGQVCFWRTDEEEAERLNEETWEKVTEEMKPWWKIF